MDNIVLDLGSDVNVLPKKTWEMMGTPKLVWLPIQPRLSNYQKIIPFGRLESVPIDIDGVRSNVTFEVIELVDDSNPYPALLGLDWAFYNLSIVNLKKRQLFFDQGDLRFIAPLDPKEGRRYVELVRDKVDAEGLDTIYKMTMCIEYYINPKVDGNLSWHSIISCSSNSEEGLENWQ